MSKMFFPLTGTEVGEIIKRRISDKIDNDQTFREHLTYPKIRWRWYLEIETEPEERANINLEAAGAIENPGEAPFGAPVVPLPKLPPARLTGSDDVRAGFPGVPEEAVAPDTIREDAGLPLMAQAHTKIGNAAMIFDQVQQTRSRGARPKAEAK